MYSLCKEMLDGVGLLEIAACAGLSNSLVSGILKHSHARNNRAVLFNLACAIIVHLSDIVVLEEREIATLVTRLHEISGSKRVSSADGTPMTATCSQTSLKIEPSRTDL